MSIPFGSSNLFTGAGTSSSSSSAASASQVPPSFGLRQRHAAPAVGVRGDENDNPNSTISQRNSRHVSKIPAPPPRLSLATSGKFIPRRSATTTAAAAVPAPANNDRQSPLNVADIKDNTEDTIPQAAAPKNDKVEKKSLEDELSLWVVGYGYRNETHFRALYQRLEKCGTITSRRGGLSCFGDEVVAAAANNNNIDGDGDTGDNWVAVRYESALCAQKALCQHGNLVSIGGSTMVMGVMALSESMDLAVRLGIPSVGGGLLPASSKSSSSSSREGSVKLIGRSGYESRQKRELRTEEDILLLGDDERKGGDETIDDGLKSSIDNFCGKIMAWFFMWDT